MKKNLGLFSLIYFVFSLLKMDSERHQPETTNTPLPEDLESIKSWIQSGRHTIDDLKNLPKKTQIQLLSNILDQDILNDQPSRTPSTYFSRPIDYPKLGTYYYTQDFHPQPKYIITTIEDKIKFKLLELCGGVFIIHPNPNQENQEQKQIYTNCLVFSTGHWVNIQYFKPTKKNDCHKKQYQIEENRITFL